MDSQLRTQPTSNRLKALLKEVSLSEHGSEVFRVRFRRLSEYGPVAYLVERPTRETRTEQYSDTVLNWAKYWTKISGHFRASLVVHNDPPKFIPKSGPNSQFITPCLVTTPVAEISNFISASFWGLGRPNLSKGNRWMLFWQICPPSCGQEIRVFVLLELSKTDSN